jgi:hypothetical protein
MICKNLAYLKTSFNLGIHVETLSIYLYSGTGNDD